MPVLPGACARCRENRLRWGRFPSSFKAALTHILDRQIIIEAILRTFAAVARFLYAAKGGRFRSERALVDADDTRLERARHAIDPAHILAVKVRCEAER